MALTLSGTNGVVGAGFTLDPSGTSVTAGVGTFGSIKSDGIVQIGGATENSADIDATNTKVTIKQSANAAEDGIYIERSGERRGHYIYVGSGLSQNDALCVRSQQLGTDTDVLAIDRGGDVVIGAGNLIIGTAGKGIDFSVQTPTSATGATTTAEVLDHYEEGTFTPIISDGSSNSTFGGITAATYTKIGNIVRASFRCVNAQTSGLTSTNTFYVKGLPFSTVNRNYSTAWLRTFDSAEWSAAKCLIFAYIESNQIYFQGDDGGSAGKTLEVRDVTHNSGDMFMTMVYETTD